MATIVPQLLYMLEEDLYRYGNASTSRVDQVRVDDVTTYKLNGIIMVHATGGYLSHH